MRVNGQAIGPMPSREDGLMAVPVPRGRADLAADWTATRDVLIGRLVSAAALVMIALLWLLDLRRGHARR
jgi:hypothetical protein